MKTKNLTYEILKRDVLNGGVILANDLYDYLMKNGGYDNFEVISGDLMERVYSYDDLTEQFGNNVIDEITEYLERYEGFDPETGSLNDDFDFYEDSINEYLQNEGYLTQNEYFQYFILSDFAARELQELTDETIIYFPETDTYFWAVGIYGTSWSICRIELNSNVWIDDEYLTDRDYLTAYPNITETADTAEGTVTNK